jgi:hypothetical protein
MPRSNRARGRARAEEPELDLSRVLAGRAMGVEKHSGRWNVQSVSAAAAAKSYSCPGCGLVIEPGTAHTVAWRADGLMGEADDLAARRHWHNRCWAIAR